MISYLCKRIFSTETHLPSVLPNNGKFVVCSSTCDFQGGLTYSQQLKPGTFNDTQQLASNFDPHFDKNPQQLQAEIEKRVAYKNVYTYWLNKQNFMVSGVDIQEAWLRI